jgi:hypothetical protein
VVSRYRSTFPDLASRASLSLEARLRLVRGHRRRNMLRQHAIGPLAVAMAILMLGAISGMAAVR